MADRHRLGSKDELLVRAPFSVKVERHRIAVFLHDGRLRAISDICNHKGGPLSEGTAGQVFAALGAAKKAFAGIDYAQLASSGSVVSSAA